MSLGQIIGQDKAVRILRGILERNAVAHCYLFAGEEGVGKSRAAHEFSKALICARQAGDACDTCSSCHRIDTGQHPDVHTLGGEERQIKIDQIRELGETLGKKSFEGGLKAAIVREAETMNPPAANAFLKTLEEPPAHSVIVLVSARPHLLPETIRSRAQTIRFSPLSREALAETLATDSGLDNPELRAALSEGRLARALDPALCQSRDTFLEGLRQALKDAADADQLWKDRDDIDEWFDMAILWLRDCMVFKASGSADHLANPDQVPLLEEMCQGATLKDLSRVLSLLFRMRDLQRFNLNKHLTFHHTLMHLKSVLR